MPFQRKGVVIGSAHRPPSKSSSQISDKALPGGVRPSPLDGRPTTSTGTASLDRFFGGHNGLPLGTSVLVEETGATDFAGVVARYYAAEGLVQGHHVHVIGYGDAWKADLPGLTSSDGSVTSSRQSKGDAMKIAWRYERLDNGMSRKGVEHETANTTLPDSFCHTFDLSKRLDNNSIRGALISYPVTPRSALRDEGFSDGTLPPESQLQSLLRTLREKLETSPQGLIHRIVIPNFMSPVLYTLAWSPPEDILRFMHGLRALLRRNSDKVSAVVTLPISLYPRASGFTRWLETFADSVLELQVLAMAPQHGNAQGLLNIHSLPIYQERGGGPQTSSSHANLSFKLSGPGGLVIEQFSLPPVDGEDETEKNSGVSKTAKLEF